MTGRLGAALLTLRRRRPRVPATVPPPAARVHALRVWLKRVRAFLRLLDLLGYPDTGPAMLSAQRAARHLAPFRNRHVLADVGRRLGVPLWLPPIRTPARRLAAAARAVERLRTELGRLQATTRTRQATPPDLERAVATSIRRCHRALRRCGGSGGPKAVHRLRRRLKDLAYQLEAIDLPTLPLADERDWIDRITADAGRGHDLVQAAAHVAGPDAARSRAALTSKASRHQRRAVRMTRTLLGRGR